MRVRLLLPAVLLAGLLMTAIQPASGQKAPLRLAWSENILTVSGDHLPGGEVKVWYLEAFCRPGSTDRDWNETVIPRKTELLSAAPDRIRLRSTLEDGVVVQHDLRAAPDRIRLRSTLEDGVVVQHDLRAHADEVDFRLTAENPTDRPSEAHWAQPCVRVDRFTGVPADRSSEAYLPQSFIFVDGKLSRMPTQPWATKARYTPGQTWCPKHVPRTDVNPRPLSSIIPSNGLIGCFSKDGKQILATAWEPYQELFQGIIVCLHSDFRLGGLKPREKKQIRGKLYLTDGNVDALLRRYRRDFPEHR